MTREELIEKIVSKESLNTFKNKIKDRNERYYQTLGNEIGDELKTLLHQIQSIYDEINVMQEKIDLLGFVPMYLEDNFVKKFSKFKVGQVLYDKSIVKSVSFNQTYDDIYVIIEHEDDNRKYISQTELLMKENVNKIFENCSNHLKMFKFIAGGIQVNGQPISMGEIKRNVYTATIQELNLKLVKLTYHSNNIWYQNFLTSFPYNILYELLPKTSNFSVEVIEDFDKVFEFYVNNEPLFVHQNCDLVIMVKQKFIATLDNEEEIEEVNLKYANLIY